VDRVPGFGFVYGMQDTGSCEPNVPTPQQSTFTCDDFTSGDGGFVAVDSTSTAKTMYVYGSNQNLAGFTRQTFTSLYQLTGSVGVGLKVNGAGGATLTQQNAAGAFTFDNTLPFTTPYILNSVNAKQMLIGTNYLYESTDQGDNL